MSNLEIKSCDVGIVFALGVESGETEDLLQGAVRIRGRKFDAREGGIHGQRVVAVRSGAGWHKSAHAAELLIDGHCPKLLVSAGFAGGLDPKLKRHDLLLADQIITENNETADIHVSGKLRQTVSESFGLHVGKLLTIDRVVRQPNQKIKLFERYQAAAIDMETYAVAEVCRRRSVPFLAVRVILDAADDSLPSYVEGLLSRETEAARWGAAIGLLFRRPSRIKDLWALKEKSLIAAERLAKFIETYLHRGGAEVA